VCVDPRLCRRSVPALCLLVVDLAWAVHDRPSLLASGQNAR
jgi:hypothetical protein